MSNPNFNPQHSTNDIWRDNDDTRCLTDDLDAMDVLIAGKAEVNHTHTGYASTSHEHDEYAPITHEHSGYANINHAHSEYVSQSDLELIEDVIDTKADTSHTHSEYASSSHTHSDYATVTALNALETEIDSKANVNHAHSEYAEASHSHANYAEVNHAHDEDYAAIAHTHDNYATVSALNEVSIAVSDKADVSHSHNNVYYTETEIDTKLAEKSDSTHTHTGVYDVSGSAANALTSAKSYTDSEIDSLSDIVADKANSTDLTSHTGNTTVHITSTERNNWNAAKSHASSAHAPTNAEENQNAFSNIVIGDTTISADTKTDTLTLVAGNNITLAPDTTGDSITISSANTVYTHPTSAGNKHIPAGGSSGQILRWSANGTAVWGNDNNTTYSEATQTTSGLMSDIDKVKLDGIAANANNYVLPSAGSSLGGVKSGGDVTISSGVITINDDSHNHIISNIDGLQSALDSKASSGHNHDSVYYTETEVDTLLSGKANSSHTHTIANVTGLQTTLDGKANSSHGTHVSYSTTAPVMDGTASVGTASTVARSDHKHPTDTSRASQASLDSHTSNKSNPHGVTLAQLGLTATAAEINKMDGVTATTTELNYVDGVTSNIQTQLNGKAASSHTHNYAGSSSAGGAATSANKLTTARTISLTGDVTGSTSFDGSGNVSITATIADDSHNHTIANVDGLQTALDGKSATSHNHNSAYISKDLQFTGDNGGAIISYNRDDGKNILTEIAALPAGFYTIYSQSGTSGNPKTTEAWRFMVHKTGATAGWVQGYGSIGSVYTNYIDGTNGWRGWKCIWDNDPNPLWSGQYYMSSPNSTPQTVTPSKKLSECRTGWLLLWSDYDAGSGSNDSDFVTTIIPKNNPSGGTWGGKSFLCDIPRYVGSNAEDVDTERRIIKPIYVHDDCIKGSYQNDKDERNDVVLRAVYEI